MTRIVVHPLDDVRWGYTLVNYEGTAEETHTTWGANKVNGAERAMVLAEMMSKNYGGCIVTTEDASPLSTSPVAATSEAPTAPKPKKVLATIICPKCGQEVKRTGQRGKPRTKHEVCPTNEVAA